MSMLEGRAMAPHRYCKNGFNNYGHLYLVPMVITFVAVLCMVQLFGLTHWWMDLFYIWIHFCRIMERILLLINVKPVVSTANINIKTVANNFSPISGRYLWPLNCCGLRPQRTMAAEGRKKGLCDLSNVVAFGHNELWRPKAAKFITKLAKISPNGNTAYHSRPPHWSCCHRWNCRVHIIYYCYSFAKPAALTSKFEH